METATNAENIMPSLNVRDLLLVKKKKGMNMRVEIEKCGNTRKGKLGITCRNRKMQKHP